MEVTFVVLLTLVVVGVVAVVTCVLVVRKIISVIGCDDILDEVSLCFSKMSLFDAMSWRKRVFLFKRKVRECIPHAIARRTSVATALLTEKYTIR